jgi:hypothetical protein
MPKLDFDQISGLVVAITCQQLLELPIVKPPAGLSRPIYGRL